MGQVEGSDARRGQPKRYGRTKCRNCLKIFEKTRPWSRFCHSKCRDTFHNDNKKLEKLEE